MPMTRVPVVTHSESQLAQVARVASAFAGDDVHKAQSWTLGGHPLRQRSAGWRSEWSLVFVAAVVLGWSVVSTIGACADRVRRGGPRWRGRAALDDPGCGAQALATAVEPSRGRSFGSAAPPPAENGALAPQRRPSERGGRAASAASWFKRGQFGSGEVQGLCSDGWYGTVHRQVMRDIGGRTAWHA